MSEEKLQVYNYGNKTVEAAYWVSKGVELGKDCKISASQPANFVTPIGTFKKRKEIEKKGLKDLRNARFITLTLDRQRMGDEQTGYETGKRQLRQFMYELRKMLGVTEEQCPHCWKLEFHKDGWAHWHLIFLYRKKLPFAMVDACWRLGRTETQRVKNQDFEYLFKYVTKSELGLPQYILEQKQVRFFQTSKHFFNSRTTGANKSEASPRQAVEEKPALGTQKKFARKETTLGERISRWLRTISIRIGRRVAIVEIASFPALLRRAAFQAYDDLELGFEAIEVNPTFVKMPSTRAIEFLDPEFRDELEKIAA